MATIPRRHLLVIMIPIIFCILCYYTIFESKIYNGILSEYKIEHLPTIFIQNNVKTPSKIIPIVNKTQLTQDTITKSPLSYSLNSKLYNLSSIQRTSIKSSDWLNPSIITNSTIIIGFCCEIRNNFDCILPKFVLILSMALWNKPTQNIYFQKCLQNGLPPTRLSDNVLTIKQRRDPKLNNNGAKKWKLSDDKTRFWFQPDIYLCQGYFWEKQIIETRSNATQHVEFKHAEAIDLLSFDITYGRTTSVPSHKLETYRPFLVTTNTEYWGGGKCRRYDLVFDTVIGRSATGCFAVHAPPAFWYEFMRINNKTLDLVLPESDSGKQEYLQHVLSIKDRKLFHTLFLVKYCYVDKRYNADAVVRVLFFDMLRERYRQLEQNWTDAQNISIDALGRCRKNNAAIKKMGGSFVQRGRDQTFGYQGVRDGAAEMALKYKFMISMENSRTKGYMTEKFFNALYGYTIPIYFGDDMIDTYFNGNRFVNCNISDDAARIMHGLTHQNRKEGNSNTERRLIEQIKEIIGDRLEECVDMVIEIDRDEEKYKTMLLEPVFKNNVYDGSIMDPFTIADRFKKVLKFVDSYLLDD